MKTYLQIFTLIIILVTGSSCHPTHFVVGNGPQQNKTAVAKNKFLFLGLKPIGTAPDPKVMSNQAVDYTITVKLTFADVLLNVITLGVYSPLTVEVKY